MAVRSRHFFGPGATPGSSPNTLYTVPTNRVAVFKDVRVFNDHASAARTFQLRATPSGSSVRTLVSVTLAAQTEWHWDTEFFVLHEGDAMVLACATGITDLRASGSGALLDGDPS